MHSHPLPQGYQEKHFSGRLLACSYVWGGPLLEQVLEVCRDSFTTRLPPTQEPLHGQLARSAQIYCQTLQACPYVLLSRANAQGPSPRPCPAPGWLWSGRQP